MDVPGTHSATSARGFTTTHWSVVINAQADDSPQAAQALEQLCRNYWYPLYAYVRRQGRSPEDAQDLTQSFFARLLAGNSLGGVDRRKGKFRSFLLGAMNHFLADEWDRARCQKRGGGQSTLSLDETDAEERYRLEPAEELTAERIYERRWALTLLEQVLRELEAEFAQAGSADQFAVLKIFLLGDKGELSYADAAARTGMNENAVGVAIHRMRRRYGELFREAIAHTVSNPAEVDEEIAYLLCILGD